MGLTLASRRSAIIDSAVNEECGVYRLRAKERQCGQSEPAEKIPGTALLYPNSETPIRKGAGPLPVPLEICEGEKCLDSRADISVCQQWRKVA